MQATWSNNLGNMTLTRAVLYVPGSSLHFSSCLSSLFCSLKALVELFAMLRECNRENLEKTWKRNMVPKEESSKRPNNTTFNVQLSNVVWQILREPDSYSIFWTKCWPQNLGLSMLRGKEHQNWTTDAKSTWENRKVLIHRFSFCANSIRYFSFFETDRTHAAICSIFFLFWCTSVYLQNLQTSFIKVIRWRGNTSRVMSASSVWTLHWRSTLTGLWLGFGAN